jgi:hypothetical protein
MLLGAGGAVVAASLGVASWRATTGTMHAYATYSERLRAPLSQDIRDVIRYATLAPNSHNTHQRFQLEATRLGLKLAFINQPVEVAALRPELARLIGTNRRPDLVLRFGHGPTLPYAPRRPVTDVLSS